MSMSSKPTEPSTVRRPIAAGRIALAIALLAAFGGGQWILLQMPVDVDLPPDDSPGGPLVGHRGLHVVSLLLHGAATLDAAASGPPLQRLISDAASLDPATHTLVIATGGSQPPPGGTFSYRMEAAADGSVESCQTRFRWWLEAGTRLGLVQDSQRLGCDIEMLADRASTLRLSGSSIDTTQPGCFRALGLGDWRDRIQDPLTLTVEIPANTSIRWQFADDSAACSPFDSTSLRLRRAAVHDGPALPTSGTAPSQPSWQAWIAGDKSALTLAAWRFGAGAMELDLRGEGRIESRGRLQTDNRLDALMDFPPFARTLAIILDFGLLAWIARLVLGRRDHGGSGSLG